jgi:hypothetical protein
MTGNAVPPIAAPTGRTPNRPESAQANASPMGRTVRRARRVRRGGGGGAAAGIVHALLLQPARRDVKPRHARSTAQTALFGIRRHTRGMMCASDCARSAGVVGRQRVRREHSTLRLTVRGDRAAHSTRARSSRRTARLALRALRRHVGHVVCSSNGGFGRRPRCIPPALPGRAHARTRDTSVVAEVLIVRTRALGEFRSDSIAERLPPTPVARGNIRLFFRF